MEPIPDTVNEAKSGQVMGHRGKPTTIILLNEHNDKTIPSDISL